VWVYDVRRAAGGRVGSGDTAVTVPPDA